MSQDQDTEAMTAAERFLAMSPEEQEAALAALQTGAAPQARRDAADAPVRPDDSHEVDGEHVPHFVADEDEEEERDPRDAFSFTLGRKDEPVEGARLLYAHRPKAWVLMQLAIVDPNTKDLSTITNVINTFLDHVLVQESRDYVRSRMLDPDDSWDVDMLVPVIQACKARWYQGRPTGRATGSSGSPGSRGKRSTGRSPSKGRKRRKG